MVSTATAAQRVQDLYTSDRFKALLRDAANNASTDWEEAFVCGLAERFEEYGCRLFLTDAQDERLQQIANKGI